MRVASLDLSRYGHFTDARLDFGKAHTGGRDFHLVFGGNEAGKTTLFTALLDLLYGFPQNTPYAFLHPHPALRIGASLETAGRVRNVVRLWKPNALLDDNEQPLPEGLFSEALAGLDRSSYRTMFSLDDETLVAGGEAIVASRGELGQMLFSASAGLSDFSDTIAALRLETDAFFKSHARKHELSELKKRLAELKDRKAEIDVLATTFARLGTNRDAAVAAYEGARATRVELRTALEKVQRFIAVFPRVLEWRGLSRELDVVDFR